MLFWVLAAAFTVWMGVEAVRRGQASPWLWIILIFGPIGAAVFFFSEYLSQTHSLFRAPAKVGSEELRQAEAEVRRLDTAAAWLDYAAALRSREKLKDAVEAARTALARDPSSVQGHFELGMSLRALDRASEAIQPLEFVIAKDPGYELGEAAFALADVQARTQDLAGARATLESLVERSSQPRFLYSLALVQAGTDDKQAARRSLERILDEAKYVPDYLERGVRPWVRKARGMLKKLG
jgi:hypothetical protein